MTTTTTWGTISGQEITFPMEVDSFVSATLGFSVPAGAAAALLPGDAFEVVEVGPGTAQLIVSLVDYRENPWGDYNEVNLGFLARPVGAGEEVIGSFVYRMPVDQEFTCLAGNQVMGFPKVVMGIDATYTETHASFELRDGDAVALSVTVPRAESAGDPIRIDTVSYSYLDGVPQQTPLAMDLATGAVDASDVELTLGTGPIADDCAPWACPRRPTSRRTASSSRPSSSSALPSAADARRCAVVRLDGRRARRGRVHQVAPPMNDEPSTCPACGHELSRFTEPPLDRAERAAGRVIVVVGSWWFPTVVLLAIVVWLAINVLLRPFEPYPIIVFAVPAAALSTLAAVQGPLILLAQRRMAARDRRREQENYLVTVRIERDLHELQDSLRLVVSRLDAALARSSDVDPPS